MVVSSNRPFSTVCEIALVMFSISRNERKRRRKKTEIARWHQSDITRINFSELTDLIQSHRRHVQYLFSDSLWGIVYNISSCWCVCVCVCVFYFCHISYLEKRERKQRRQIWALLSFNLNPAGGTCATAELEGRWGGTWWCGGPQIITFDNNRNSQRRVPAAVSPTLNTSTAQIWRRKDYDTLRRYLMNMDQLSLMILCTA